jgi:hypothetical protein
LAQNQLEGTIPADLGNLNFLRRLRLHSNHLIGDIPANLSNIPMLRWFSVEDNVGKIASENGIRDQINCASFQPKSRGIFTCVQRVFVPNSQ